VSQTRTYGAVKVSTWVDVDMFGIAGMSSNHELFKTISAEKSMTDIILESVEDLNSGLAATA